MSENNAPCLRDDFLLLRLVDVVELLTGEPARVSLEVDGAPG